MKGEDLKNCPVKEIKPCPYINGFTSDNAGVSFVLQKYDGYSDFVLFKDGEPNRCFRFTASVAIFRPDEIIAAITEGLKEARDKFANNPDDFMGVLKDEDIVAFITSKVLTLLNTDKT